MLNQKIREYCVWNLSQHICLILFIFAAETLFFQTKAASTIHSPSEVLLVYNSNSPISTAIASYYEAQRGVTNVVAVSCQDSALNSVNENIPLS